MDVWRIMIAALRRWYVLVPLLALTGVAVFLVDEQVAPEYEARASALVTPPPVPAERMNPYGNLEAATQVLAIVLNSTDTRRSMAEAGLSQTYEVAAAPRSSIFDMTIRDDDADSAEQSGFALLDRAADELAERQGRAGIPSNRQFTVEILESPTVAAIVDTSRSRVQAVIAILGAGLAVLIAVLFDDIVGLIRRARHSRQDAPRDNASEGGFTEDKSSIEEPDDPMTHPDDADTVQLRIGSHLVPSNPNDVDALPSRPVRETDSREPVPQHGHPLGRRHNPLFDPQLGNPWSGDHGSDTPSDQTTRRS